MDKKDTQKDKKEHTEDRWFCKSEHKQKHKYWASVALKEESFSTEKSLTAVDAGNVPKGMLLRSSAIWKEPEVKEVSCGTLLWCHPKWSKWVLWKNYPLAFIIIFFLRNPSVFQISQLKLWPYCRNHCWQHFSPHLYIALLFLSWLIPRSPSPSPCNLSLYLGTWWSHFTLPWDTSFYSMNDSNSFPFSKMLLAVKI